MSEALPLPTEKPSQIIRRMADLLMTHEDTKTGNQQLDIVLKQLRHLAAHADATDAYLDSLFATEEPVQE